MTESDFFQALKARFPANEYAMIPQVRNSTGFSGQVRTADAIGISLWPSRGIHINGFEFKDSRNDWLKEIANSQKSEEIGRYCDHWWLVVSDRRIVVGDELPKAWGLIVVNEDLSSKIITKAPRRECEQPNIKFMAAILKSAQEVVTDEAEIKKRIAKAVAAAEKATYAALEGARQNGRNTATIEFQELEKRISEFEASSGISVRERWTTGKKIGEAVRYVLDGGLKGTEQKFSAMVRTCEIIRGEAEKMLRLEKEVGTACIYCDKISSGPLAHDECEETERNTIFEAN